ncbi:hypothetical protein [Allosphingosinicella vermicomposti]|uniref:hypothetical protein n=1 Tax=Allosphingosinicella vermicomposti TaxID=614671 RepID=UPI000D1106BC|nr:hypothetical protein [Allosphingosinicella vermicomposti]
MPKDRTEELLDLIGQLLAEDTEYPLDGTLLYAEVARAYVAPSIYKDRGNHILYREPDLDRLGDALLELWEAQTNKKPWKEIEYFVKNGRFEATYIYPEEIGPNEWSFYRRNQAAAKYFGGKPIHYPEMSEEDKELFNLGC